MKKTTRISALLLCACMLLSLLAACGSSSEDTEETEAEETTEEETTEEEESESEEEAEETEDETEEEAEDEEEAEETEDAEETEAAETTVDSSDLYPVFDELTTITAFLSIAPWASAYIGDEAEFENAQAILTAEEYTNVHLECTWSDPDTYNEKVMLLVAADDMPNITRGLDGLYSTGHDGLIEDEVCVDLMQYFEEYAPDYYALLQSSETFLNDTTSVNGATTAMYSYTEIPSYTRGPVVRQDMLDEIGASIPTTVEELHEVALELVNTGVVEAAIVSPKFVADAWAGTDFISSNDVQMTWWVIDGEITAAVTLDSNYEWALEMRQWNDEGLFEAEWYTPEASYDSWILNDELAMAFGPYSITSDATRATAADPDTCNIVPMALVTLEEGDTIKTQEAVTGSRGDGDWCITTADEDLIPQIVTYINWFFTEDGIMISNFGTEGVSFEYDENGEIQYTDLILQDTGGYGSMAVYAIFTNNNDNPFYYKYERTSLTYDNEVETTVYDTWLSNITGEYIADYKMTMEESEAYNTLATDITTTIQEYMTKFMTGSLELTEESWADFQDILVDLGLEEMREIVQTAYDRTQAG